MKVLFTVSEIYPVIKTGGLGDVAGALPVALAEQGVDTRVMLPAYPAVLDAVEGLGEPVSLGDPLGAGETRLLQGRLPGGVDVWLVHCPALYDRPAGPYLDATGRDWSDNHLRFAILARAAATVAEFGSMLGWCPDVLHAHDWHTGLAPAYLHLRAGRRPATVMTIHNLAFQGNFPAAVLGQVGLPPECFFMDGVEFHNQVSFLKAGIRYADRVTTVSPTYAREILTPALGCGFDGILRQRGADVRGILNGIDYRTWNPANDPLIERTYDAGHLARKDANKKALADRLGLADAPDAPLIGVVSRLTDQKGVDLILGAVPNLLAMGAKLAVVGSGDAAFEEAFRDAATAYPGGSACGPAMTNPGHLVQAGSDLCWFVAFRAMRAHATLPRSAMDHQSVVRRTGGLADTVIDASRGKDGTGFLFEAATSLALSGAVSRALAVYRKRPAWRVLQRRAMEQDFSWTRAAREYLDLYGELTKGRGPARRTRSPSRKRK